jgi:hypothetical protein
VTPDALVLAAAVAVVAVVVVYGRLVYVMSPLHFLSCGKRVHRVAGCAGRRDG